MSPSPNAPTPVAIPEPTLKRLPYYYKFIQGQREARRDFVSCTTLAEALGLNPIQVRKDLQATGAVGRPKVGYHVETTLDAIEECLGYHNTQDIFLVGAGHLGQALLAYPGFAEIGFNLVAAFDADPAKVGREVAGKPILEASRLSDLVRRMHIQIAILAVPAAAAQMVTDTLVRAGIRAIWNFTPTRLAVPREVLVQDENLLASLSVLSKQLENSRVKSHKESIHGKPEEL